MENGCKYNEIEHFLAAPPSVPHNPANFFLLPYLSQASFPAPAFHVIWMRQVKKLNEFMMAYLRDNVAASQVLAMLRSPSVNLRPAPVFCQQMYRRTRARQRRQRVSADNRHVFAHGGKQGVSRRKIFTSGRVNAAVPMRSATRRGTLAIFIALAHRPNWAADAPLTQKMMMTHWRRHEEQAEAIRKKYGDHFTCCMAYQYR